MSDINELAALTAFIEHETLSWPDFTTKDIFKNAQSGTERAKEVSAVLNDLENRRLVELVDRKGVWKIRDEGRRRYEQLISEIEQEEKKSSLTNEQLELQVNKLRNDVLDYPETRQRAKDGIALARLSVGLTLLTLLHKVLCNTPHQ
jgi:hypothetical protein